jgi:uncharacterized membrane protein
MVFWGIAWGAVFGFLWPGHFLNEDARVAIGAVLGALAGLSLRMAVRAELARQRSRAGSLAVPPQAAVTQRPPAAAAAGAATAAAPVQAPVPAAAIPPLATAASAADLPSSAVLRTESPTAYADTTPAGLPPLQPASPVAARPDLVSSLVLRARDWLLGGNTVVRIGVLLLFIGFAFLAKYAVENALLPPELRLAGIAVGAIALFVIGLRVRRHEGRLAYALTLQGAGIALLYLTVFAAFRLYQFLPAGVAFAALGLVCLFSAVIALAQNAQPLAFIGFAGGFAAPVLVSTGQGSHVGLFGYYLLLGVAIAAIAWVRAWRALNLLGFFATFGVATLWGALKYRPELFATTEPFLVAFFAVYLAAALSYALRHGQAARKAVDATLLFGTPIAAISLQAGLVHDMPYVLSFSSLALGGVYVVLASAMLRRRRGDTEVNRWLAECFVALALGFITLAVPLALDGRWTSAVWAVEGAGVYWMGRRQGRWLARGFGLALQVFAALLFLDGSLGYAAPGHWPFANPAFLGAAMLAGAALAIAWWSRTPLAPESRSAAAAAFGSVEDKLSPVLFWIGFLWWMTALGIEIDRVREDAQGLLQPLFGGAQREMLRMAASVLSAFALHRLALPARAAPWRIAATPAWFAVPVMLVTALWGMANQDHVFQGAGWVAWPLAIALQLVMLRRLDAGPPQRWWPWVHAGGVWLLVLLSANLLVFAIGRAQLWRTAWATVLLLAAASVVLLALIAWTRRALQRDARQRWPLDRFLHAYAWRAAAPLAAVLGAGALLVAVYSSGEARPLPYVPLLNPTDLAVALALGVCALWLQGVRASDLALPGFARGIAPVALLAGVAFIAVNTVWLRVAHHFVAVPWDAHSLFASFTVQAGYSILWTLIALALMVLSHRRALRTPWMLGAGLLAFTVLKLFVIDLSNSGGSQRIVVFIAVGLLMLVVGWLAPLPPSQRPRPAAAETDLQGAPS